MEEYSHHVSGIFPLQEDAQNALSKLMARGLPSERLHMFMPPAAASLSAKREESESALKSVVVDGAIGTAVGAGVGVLGELALVAANVTLFVASPLIAPLVMMGWGASVGGLLGASLGAAATPEGKQGKFAELIDDAISHGQIVLVAETRTEQETAAARKIIREAVGADQDVDAAA